MRETETQTGAVTLKQCAESNDGGIGSSRRRTRVPRTTPGYGQTELWRVCGRMMGHCSEGPARELCRNPERVVLDGARSGVSRDGDSNTNHSHVLCPH